MVVKIERTYDALSEMRKSDNGVAQFIFLSVEVLQGAFILDKVGVIIRFYTCTIHYANYNERQKYKKKTRDGAKLFKLSSYVLITSLF